MNLKGRIEKLEQKDNSSLPTVSRVITYYGEPEGTAERRWMDENPGMPLPDFLIERVIVRPEDLRKV